MSKTPYPGYPPSFTVVDKTGGFARTCLVIELLSQANLDPSHIAYVQEQLEAALTRILPAIVEKSRVITQESFDTSLRKGLRLS